MSVLLSKILTLAAAALILMGILVVNSNTELAKKVRGFNSLARDCATANATSTVVGVFNVPNLNYMTPGTGTTTLDNCAVASKDSLAVYAWLVASSTKTDYGLLVSRSMDGVDYYQGENSLTLNATTTSAVSQSLFKYVFASSTVEASQSVGFYGRGTTTAKLLRFNVPTLGANYVRLTFFLGGNLGTGEAVATSTNGAVWAQGVGVEKRGN